MAIASSPLKKAWLPTLGWCVLFLAVLLIALRTSSETWAPWYRPEAGGYPAEITKIASDGASLDVRTLGQDGQKVTLKAGTDPLKSQLKSGDFKIGDVVGITQASGTATQVKSWPHPEAGQRVLTLLAAALLVAGLALLLELLAHKKLSSLILGLDNRYSKSKFQFVIWFWVLLTVLLSTLWLRYFYSGHLILGGLEIPPHLLQLAGLSGLSLATAKVITQVKQSSAKSQEATVQAVAQATLQAPQALPSGQSFVAVMPA
ncbi:MAG TPA: hypothetical protein VGR07_02990, partial [Thermoanaerobaculia bacterium]|nr:hypothetical protein [Thermoanaerobaculia bacterium]